MFDKGIGEGLASSHLAARLHTVKGSRAVFEKFWGLERKFGGFRGLEV